jgi:hypothetical protein
MVRNVEIGNWCGYAAVPPGHPWHGKPLDDAPDVEVHWGLTYAAACAGHVCHAPQPGEADDVWWLGFDCGHGFDVMPFTRKMHADRGRDLAAMLETESACRMQYRDVAYVRAECERLAEQILAAG